MTIETQSNSGGPKVTRRGFLAGTGGLTFAIVLGANGAGLLTPARAKSVAQEITAWVRIAPDDVITILTPAAEMGQGSMTSVPLILAEELDADWDKVVLEWAPADPKVYGYTRKRRGRVSKSMGIYGSRAVMMYYHQMRIAGAQARHHCWRQRHAHGRIPTPPLLTTATPVAGSLAPWPGREREKFLLAAHHLVAQALDRGRGLARLLGRFDGQHRCPLVGAIEAVDRLSGLRVRGLRSLASTIKIAWS